MSIGNWKNISSYLQGDISYDFKKVLVDSVYANFELVAFGEKFKDFDIAFEYRLNDTQNWREDALIVETSAKYFKDNKMYGLSASKEGETNIIKWKYSANNLLYGNTPQIRIRFLPRLRVFGSSGQQHSIASLYGDSLVDFDGISRHNCVGINNDGNYICLGNHSIYIIDSLDVEKGSSSSESSSNSSESSSSSSSVLCTSLTCVSSSPSGHCNYLTNWQFSGLHLSNSDNGTLYVRYRKSGAFYIVEVYKDVARTQLVASASRFSFPFSAGAADLFEENSSGLNGSVYQAFFVNTTTFVIQC